MTALATVGPCDWCREPIMWLITVTDARMPVDAEPDKALGNVLRQGVRAHVIGKRSQAAAMRAAGVELRTHHRLTCPQAHRWARGATR